MLRKPFIEDTGSTEGISTHKIKSSFTLEKLETEVWLETELDSSDITARFYDEVLVKHQEMTTQVQPSTSNPELSSHVSRSTGSKTSQKENVSESVPENAKMEDISLQCPNMGTDQGELSEKFQTEPEFVKKFEMSNEILEANTSVRPAVQTVVSMDTKTRQQLLDHRQPMLDPSSEKKMDYSMTLWDYGGHTEFIATHHFFLSSESTTLILLDISKGMKDPIKKNQDRATGIGIPNTPEQFLHYWLQTIHSQTVEKEKTPNIALVLTHRDMIEARDKDKYMEEYILGVIRSIASKPYCHYITKDNIFVIDNRNDSEEDFAKLRKEVLKMITKQRSWEIERPLRWLKLEADILDKANEQTAKVLQLAEVKSLAETYGINDVELQSFLEFHHSLGDFLYYSEPGLKDVLITDPQWLADMFKTLITPEEFLEEKNLDPQQFGELKQGLVRENTLKTLWKGNQVFSLIDLFQNFNLLLPMGVDKENKMFIIPCMLPPDQRNMYEMEPFQSMVLSYNSEYKTKSGDPFQIGLFHRMLSHCSKKWQICADDHLSYTDVSFQIAEHVWLALTSLQRKKIRVSLWCSKDAAGSFDSSIILTIRHYLQNILFALGLEPSNNFLLQCPHVTAQDSESCLIRVEEAVISQGRYKLLPINDRCYLHNKPVFEQDFPDTWKGK